MIEGAGPYSAFDLSLYKHHALIESEKLARRLLMVPIDGFIDNEEATRIEKADARASRIDQRRKQFAITALKNADPPRLVGTSDASIDIDRSESEGIYRGDYDIDDDGNLSYHSSDGSDEDDSDVDLSLGDNGGRHLSPSKRT